MNNNLLAGLVIGAIVILGGIALVVYGFPGNGTTVIPTSDTSDTSGTSGTVTTTTGTTTTVAAVAPVVQTSAATLIARKAATLNGQITPSGMPAAYWFEYGISTTLGSTTAQQAAGSGTIAEAVSQSAAGLKPATKYYFRMSAQSTNGTTHGAVMSFITLP